MSAAMISESGAGQLELSGVLDFRTGPALRVSGQKLINNSQTVDLLLDCSAVEKSSSVGVSLLLAFMRDAAKAGKNITMRGLPADMQQIAEVSGLDGLLPLQS